MEKLLPDSDSNHGTIDWTRGTPTILNFNSQTEKKRSSKELHFKEMIKGLADRITQVMSETPEMGTYMLKQKRMCRKNKAKEKNINTGVDLIARKAEEMKPDVLANIEYENLDDMGTYMLKQKQRCRQGRIADK